MAWSIRCTFSPIRSYADAVKVWQKAIIFPRIPNGPRGLVDRRKKHLTIERTEAEDIILRLYGHAVVLWRKDNSITIYAPRVTRSTGKFASHCTPSGMHVSTWNDRYLCANVGGRLYKIADEITFRQHGKDWKADQITSPWQKSVVNRERAKQALVTIGYEDFRLWFKTYIQMAAKPYGSASWIDNPSIIIMLRDRNKWRDLVTSRFPNAWSQPDKALSEIRQAIYAEYECIDKKSVPFLG